MHRIESETLVQSLESLFEGGSVAGLSDCQLLERFNAARDGAGEAAFAALVARHGPMVLDLCRNLLGDLHHAEDAFQAVFLVLAHKARSIGDPDLLANWLYGVALRTARCTKAQLDRQRKRGGRREAASGSGLVCRAPSGDRACRAVVDRARAGRDVAQRDQSAAEIVSSAGGAVLLRRAHARRSGAPAELSGGDAAQPVSPGARQAQARAYAAGRDVVDECAERRRWRTAQR